MSETPSETKTSSFAITIPGRCIVKKNTARHYGYGRMQYSPQFRIWNAQAILCIKNAWKGQSPLGGSLSLDVVFYFSDGRGRCDLSNVVEGPQDVLKTAGVINDDSQFDDVRLRRKYDAKNPRTEIEIREIKN